MVFPEVKVIRFARFNDSRGFFAEAFKKSDFIGNPVLSFMRGFDFLQINENYSKPGVVRGLHFQWNPYLGKLVRTLRGRMVDVFLDIRKASKTFGQAAMYALPVDMSADYSEWIWVPPGFAHGNYFTEESQIEYLCTSEYSPGCEAGISPFAKDIDWSKCDSQLKKEFDMIASGNLLVADKDKNGFSLASWQSDPRSDNFIDNRQWTK
jgi:dTDP-4-dehydrorhamnose 3,5-epimerase